MEGWMSLPIIHVKDSVMLYVLCALLVQHVSENPSVPLLGMRCETSSMVVCGRSIVAVPFDGQ